jgi:glucose-1-phosphate adenylyltransferase
VSQGHYHLTRDLLMNAINTKSLKIMAYENPGRAWQLDSVQAYFDCSMEMLNRETRAGLFPADRPVLTKLRDEMPSRYRTGAKVKNSLIADGCVVEGTVENSILFRGVHIEKGAVVKNSVIYDKCVIKSGVRLENVICDRSATVTADTVICGTPDSPCILPKGGVI